jgi:hypothetical protein
MLVLASRIETTALTERGPMRRPVDVAGEATRRNIG